MHAFIVKYLHCFQLCYNLTYGYAKYMLYLIVRLIKYYPSVCAILSWFIQPLLEELLYSTNLRVRFLGPARPDLKTSMALVMPNSLLFPWFSVLAFGPTSSISFNGLSLSFREFSRPFIGPLKSS